MSSKPLILRDEVHGDITLNSIARAVVDHPSFQRLRYIKQLGLAEYVFPCATHTRFQHSLGAAFLAQQYFESLMQVWSQWELDLEGVKGTRFFIKETRLCLKEVAGDEKSRRFWGHVAVLAGMLHDVGHGPWSHTFEYLDLDQDFADRIGLLRGSVRQYFDDLVSSGQQIFHEEVSVLYIHKILSELEASGVQDALAFFLPVSVLVNKRILTGPSAAAVETELEQLLSGRQLQGGRNLLRLLAPLISGPFDVDRADYIQRDGRNCGVSLGGIEWRRIVRKVMPCLAQHENDRGEPQDVVLISHYKNQHVLDDFIFSLFQMYAQVYLHPKTVAFEEQIRRELEVKRPKERPVVRFDLHESLSDEGFRLWLEKTYQTSLIRKTLFRQPEARFQVVGLPVGSGEAAELARAGYYRVETQGRPMLKDSIGVFLYSSSGNPGSGKGGHTVALPWTEASPIANHFHSINHAIEIWVRPEPEVG